MIKGLVISVGGSQGAYAGGIIQNKLEKEVKYDKFYGSSVGSLMIPLIASGNIEGLKEAFTKTNMEDIFTINPFKVLDSSNGVFRYTLNYWNLFKLVFIRKASSLGDSSVLRDKTIPKFFPEESYKKIKDGNLSIMVTNISTGKLEIKNLKECSHIEFMDWMWASTCAPPFMSIAEIGGCHYIDGGVISQVPIKQAILDGCDVIDVIILNKENYELPIEHIRNLFHYQIRVLLVMMNKIQSHQVDMGYLSDIARKKVRINFHYTKRRLTNNSLIFDSETMTKWWEEGYEDSKNNKPISYLINGKKDSYQIL